jgi:carbonic anhydrase
MRKFAAKRSGIEDDNKSMKTLLKLAALAMPLLAQNPGAPVWSYEGANGPAHWGELRPEYSACSAGREQSPVDIRKAEAAKLPPLQFDYKSAQLKLINTGHTVQVNFPAGNWLTVGDSRYELKQIHFHRPSEERIDGQPSEMVIHLVHANAKGETAVVAILLRSGSANALIQKIWAVIPKTVGQEQQIARTQIDPSGFFPPNRAYYTYRGSLTTPPCTENVTWLVLETQQPVSEAQVRTFGRLFPANARPVQPLDGRVIKKSE